MKKNLIVAAMVAALSLSAAQAMANGGGQVNFNGTILDESCTITDTVASPQDIDLGTYGKNEFTAVGTALAKKDVKISLTNCPASVTSAAIVFDGKADATNPELLALTDVDNVANGVAIQLYDDSEKELALRTPSKAYTLAEGDNTLNFYAAYKSTAATVTGGPADAVANFSVDYN